MYWRRDFLYDGLPSSYWERPLVDEVREYVTSVTGNGLFTPMRVPQGVMNATSYFQGVVMEALRNLVGRACFIYVDVVKVIGRSVEELIVNLRAVLLRFVERGLFLEVHKSHEPLAFLSGVFRRSQLCWPRVDKKCFAIMSAFQRVPYLLQDGSNVSCDHRKLAYIFSPQSCGVMLSKAVLQRLAGWCACMCQFNYVIQHILGENNHWVGLLSR